MDYFRKTRRALVVDKFLRVQPFVEALQRGASRHTAMLAAARCTGLEETAFQCMSTRGEDDPECQDALFVASMCVCSQLVPDVYSRWLACVKKEDEAHGNADACMPLMETMMTAAARENDRQKEAFAETSPEEHGWMMEVDAACETLPDEEKLACVASVVCATRYTAFLDCAARNGDAYDAPQCRSAGVDLAECIGSDVTKLMSKMDMRTMDGADE